ncbi:hypothetical protein BASA82_001082 [Batrachochytrium salamandrivorans]|nr:hypothetical protein BASA82_001082 [Batrachochytrium salamandrivorans]
MILKKCQARPLFGMQLFRVEQQPSSSGSEVIFYSPHAKEIVEIALDYEGIAQVLNALQPPVASPPVIAAVAITETPTIKAAYLRKNTHRGSLGGEPSTASNEFVDYATAHHSIREQMQRLGASESDINLVLRLPPVVGAGTDQLPIDQLRHPPNRQH